MNKYDVIIIGGGAAGFFTAINAAQLNEHLKIAIIEKSKKPLQKVRISGGGRCNVTHAEFVPSELIEHYPRGKKELLGPFHQFMPSDTIDWFEKKGIELKIEEDGRMFPVSNTSETIVNCFLSEIERLNVKVYYNDAVMDLTEIHSGWQVKTISRELQCNSLVIATGSSPRIWKLLESLGHTIIKPVPSLFTFNIDDFRLKDLAGITIDHVGIELLLPESENSNHQNSRSSYGPLLITHWGLSAPAILKLSAFAARELAACDYKFKIEINVTGLDKEDCIEKLLDFKFSLAKKKVVNCVIFDLPKRFFQKLVTYSGIEQDKCWADLNKQEIVLLAEQLTCGQYEVHGKSTFKEEFVTAGGIDLKEIDFRTFQSKILNNVYFAGEVLNIDAVTGGFNFQNAWTGGYIAANAIARGNP